MKTNYKHCLAGLLSTFVLLLQTFSETFACQTPKEQFQTTIHSELQVTGIEMEGRIQNDEGYMSEVTITVYIDSVLFLTTTSTRAGKCKFTLPLDKKYTIVFSMPGYISKKLMVNAQVLSPEHALSTFHFTIDMKRENTREYKPGQMER